MIILNLLSQEEKKHISLIKNYFIIKNVSFFIISFLIIIATITIFTNILLENYLQSLETQIKNEVSISSEGKIASIEEAIKELNSQLLLAKNVEESYVLWTKILTSLVEKLPEGVTLNNINLNSQAMTLKISGTAVNRDAYLNTKSSLELVPYFSNISSPISNLTKKDDIPFTFVGQLTNLIYE
ncbi:MAG: hypothetical protein WCV50_00255 [Patescibacteria group bacterium]|jgi:Tfp pilus assembly protein PilN